MNKKAGSRLRATTVSPVSGSARLRAAPYLRGAGQFVLDLTLSGSSLSGSITIAGMLESGVSGTYDKDSGKATLSLTDGSSISLELQISDNTLSGTVEFGGGTLTINGTREVPDQPESDEDSDEDTEESEEEDKEPKEPKIDFGKRWATALRFEIEPVVAV